MLNNWKKKKNYHNLGDSEGHIISLRVLIWSTRWAMYRNESIKLWHIKGEYIFEWALYVGTMCICVCVCSLRRSKEEEKGTRWPISWSEDLVLKRAQERAKKKKKRNGNHHNWSQSLPRVISLSTLKLFFFNLLFDWPQKDNSRLWGAHIFIWFFIAHP